MKLCREPVQDTRGQIEETESDFLERDRFCFFLSHWFTFYRRTRGFISSPQCPAKIFLKAFLRVNMKGGGCGGGVEAGWRSRGSGGGEAKTRTLILIESLYNHSLRSLELNWIQKRSSYPQNGFHFPIHEGTRRQKMNPLGIHTFTKVLSEDWMKLYCLMFGPDDWPAWSSKWGWNGLNPRRLKVIVC